MNPLEIALIIIGIIIIIISCRLVDKNQKVSGQVLVQPFSFEQNVSEEDKMKIMEKIGSLLYNRSEETIEQTEEVLNKLSNEKIMAISEFSDQILEKIRRNHEEVVFLYNMLNDKEKELKTVVKEIDQSKKIVKDIIDTKTNTDKIKDSKDVKTQKPITQASRLDHTANTVEAQADFTGYTAVSDNYKNNNNTDILSLYSQGKTVIEISKMLGLGQGEVKLVIDLFKGKK